MSTMVALCGIVLLSTAWGAGAQDVRSGVEQLAQQLIQAAPEDRDLRVVVIDFPDLLGVTSNLGRYIANRLTTRLAQSQKFFVVERQRLNQVLAELRFSMTDLVDPEKAKQLGKVIGVEAVIIGTVSDLGNQVDIDARVIEAETSRMLMSVATTISKDQVVSQLMERGRLAAAQPQTPPPPDSSPQHTAQPPEHDSALKSQDFPEFRVDVEDMQVIGDNGLSVFLRYTNKTQEDLTIGLDSSSKTFVVDNTGNHFKYRRGSGLSGGLVANRMWPPGTCFLSLPAGGSSSASFIFQLQRGTLKENTSSFHFTSEQLFVENAANPRQAKAGKKFNITIRNIKLK